ncbi:hypothetical protein LEP1GSC047_2884 [Leptospira inadai serovar Lyme str. 10]|uniref:Uncharacterized protein n=1 Tax=Leptospira inadai serovar Lyme str. 10 TaxID=1049790 RepID=V6HC99_9LEPT|nr:hypothetical protein LEP1GSC047_2884 [Leptospira inadai serovar Lyme str. 10]
MISKSKNFKLLIFLIYRIDKYQLLPTAKSDLFRFDALSSPASKSRGFGSYCSDALLICAELSQFYEASW